MVTDPAHLAQAVVLRHAYQHPPARPCEADLSRDLADYDAAFGIDPATLSAPMVI